MNDGIIASNNLNDVVVYVEKFNLTLFTSSIILALSFEEEIITMNEANNIWNQMLKNNRELPSNSFSNYYNIIFPNDSKRFLKNLN